MTSPEVQAPDCGARSRVQCRCPVRELALLRRQVHHGRDDVLHRRARGPFRRARPYSPGTRGAAADRNANDPPGGLTGPVDTAFSPGALAAEASCDWPGRVGSSPGWTSHSTTDHVIHSLFQVRTGRASAFAAPLAQARGLPV